MPPALAPLGTSTARASMPASCALASVWPTAATCGSVKVTRGLSAPSQRSSTVAAEDAVGGDAALVLAHVGQQDAAVGVADRVEPVVAGRRAACRRPRSGARAPGRGRRGRGRRSGCAGRRPRGSRRRRRSSRRRARRVTRPFAARDGRRLGVGADLDAARRASAAHTCSPANGSSRASRRGPASTTVTLEPNDA